MDGQSLGKRRKANDCNDNDIWNNYDNDNDDNNNTEKEKEKKKKIAKIQELC